MLSCEAEKLLLPLLVLVMEAWALTPIHVSAFFGHSEAVNLVMFAARLL
jgi:hypothetical protein